MISYCWSSSIYIKTYYIFIYCSFKYCSNCTVCSQIISTCIIPSIKCICILCTTSCWSSCYFCSSYCYLISILWNYWIIIFLYWWLAYCSPSVSVYINCCCISSDCTLKISSNRTSCSYFSFTITCIPIHETKIISWCLRMWISCTCLISDC